MGWGNSTNVSTANLDAGTKSPAAARPDLEAALLELIEVIDGRNTANGVPGLDSSSKLTASQLPNTLVSSSGQDLTLDPATAKVQIESILRLEPQTVAQLNARTDIQQGDIAFCSDGDGGTECLAVAIVEADSAGAPAWHVVSIGSAIST